MPPTAFWTRRPSFSTAGPSAVSTRPHRPSSQACKKGWTTGRPTESHEVRIFPSHTHAPGTFARPRPREDGRFDDKCFTLLGAAFGLPDLWIRHLRPRQPSWLGAATLPPFATASGPNTTTHTAPTWPLLRRSAAATSEWTQLGSWAARLAPRATCPVHATHSHARTLDTVMWRRTNVPLV